MKEPRLKILEAAASLFNRYGFKKTSVDEIALEAGIAKSTMYQHFRSKEDILLAAVIHEARTVRSQVMKSLESETDPLVRLRLMGELGLDAFRAKPFVVGLLSDPSALVAPARHPEIIALAEGEMMDILMQIIEQGQKLGRIRAGDARTMAYLFLKVFQSFTFARTGSLPFSERDSEREKREVLDVLIRGIAATGP